MLAEGMQPVVWIRSSKRDLLAFPPTARKHIGFALKLAQLGGKHPDAKPMRGFGGGGVVEIVEDHDGNTYRAVYTVRFSGALYVLHCFQKKSRHGIATSRRDLAMVRERLRYAQELQQQGIV